MWCYSTVATIAEARRRANITPDPLPADAPQEVRPVLLAGISVRPGDALRNVFYETHGELFDTAAFSKGRAVFNSVAVQEDPQAQTGVVLIEDPRNNFKRLLRLFQNTSGDLEDYDVYTKPMRKVQDDFNVNGLKTWTS